MKIRAHARLIVLTATVFLLGAQIVSAAELEGHPLITPYPGSTLSRSERADFDTYQLIVGVEASNPVGRKLEGTVTRLGLYQPADKSTLEIFRNYESALADAGMETIFSCSNEECGPSYTSSAWNRLSGITAKSGANCRYLAGKLATQESTAYIAIMVGRRRHNIHIVEVKEMEGGLVTVNAAALAEGIERQGRVSVDGIFFDTGKAVLKSESKAALDEVAKLMAHLPKLVVYVVGHTDDTGNYESNMSLSQNRAKAVVKALIEDYGIASERMSGHGVGPLSPAATNRSEPGRSRNRRVVLVERVRP